MQNKKFIVWYLAGSGGYVVSWLLQLALDPSKDNINNAMSNFPLSLINNGKKWKKTEQVPPNVGLLSAGLYRSSCYSLHQQEERSRKTLDELLSTTEKTIDDLTRQRIRYFLVNHVFGRSLVTPETLNIDFAEYGMDDVEYVKEATDILFDKRTMVFVTAPTEFIGVARETKLTNQNVMPTYELTDILSDYDVPTFDIQTLWKGNYIQEIEKILNRKLTQPQELACTELVERWIQVTPEKLKRCMDAL